MTFVLFKYTRVISSLFNNIGGREVN
jgi:hypothetical protein